MAKKYFKKNSSEFKKNSLDKKVNLNLISKKIMKKHDVGRSALKMKKRVRYFSNPRRDYKKLPGSERINKY